MGGREEEGEGGREDCSISILYYPWFQAIIILLPQHLPQGPLLPPFSLTLTLYIRLFLWFYFYQPNTFLLCWSFLNSLCPTIFILLLHTIHFHYSSMIWLYLSFLKQRMPECLWKSTCQNIIKMFSLLHCLREMNDLLNHQFQICIQFWDIYH